MAPIHFRNKILRLLHRVNHSKATWLRVLLSLSIGGVVFYMTDKSQHDQRFKIRGSQSTSRRVLILSISPSAWQIMAQKMGYKNSDLSQWEPHLWNRVLEKLQIYQPHTIGIDLSFSHKRKVSHSEKLKNYSNVYWHSPKKNNKAIRPLFLDKKDKNFGTSFFPRDNDQITRRYHFPLETMTFLEKMTGDKASAENQYALINFRGTREHFQHVNLTDILEKNFPQDFLKDKYILIGNKKQNKTLLTPIGPMTKIDLLANGLDNIIENRWIHRPPRILFILYLIVLILVTAWLVSTYPQTIGLALLFWLGTLSTALSIWAFDSFYLWIPILSPLCLLVVTYILFLNLQLDLKEKANWLLEQEHKIQAESEMLKSNFLSLISHDLKTPIAKIQAICDQLIQQPDLSPQHIRELKSLRHENSELHRYIQSILRVSQVETQGFQIHKNTSDINEIIGNITRQLSPLAKEKQITIEENLEPIFLIELDNILIYEVILNVVENAIKYSETNGHVTIKTQEKDNQVEITVTDQGPGISPSDIAKIFDKFYRASTQTSHTKGSGLGLYLVKYFIELHSGQVSLKSELGKGTQVRLLLPIPLS